MDQEQYEEYVSNGWDPEKESVYNEIWDILYLSRSQRDLGKLEKLFLDNPEFLRIKGHDQFLHSAAEDGDLELVKLLIRVGIGIDEISNVDFGDNFSIEGRVEGSIVNAAESGQLEVVKWLIENDAKVNYEVDGKNRCAALTRAVQKGHFDVVKLLIENGAEINSVQNGKNPLMIAISGRNQELVDYFRSLGQQPLYETVPRNVAGAREAYLKFVSEEDQFGPVQDWHEWLDDTSFIALRLCAPTEEWRNDVLE